MYENVKGVHKNVYFVSHSFNESAEIDSKSKVNQHEAKFLIQLCKYLILQGYEPSQITILTTYSGQLFALKSLATGDVKKVRITVVDNFQGEENDIILISFVRSNRKGVIGFLKVPNRVCVALSRAKKGLFCIGNFKLLAEESNVWKNIVSTLNLQGSIGPSLQLTCQNHPDVNCNVVTNSDFKNVPNGGCTKQCQYKLCCGHVCSLMCHPYDQEHKEIVCKKPCTKICERSHACKNLCFEACYCKVLVDKILKRCGHTMNDFCGKLEEEIMCQTRCIKTCDKGHQCQIRCFEDCGACEVLIDKTLEQCGHSLKVACGEKGLIRCLEPCVKTCDEGHQCQKKCFQVCGLCKVLVDKTLKRCKHIVKTSCGIKEYEIACNFKCEKILHCSHQCSKLCSEICTRKCEQPCRKTCAKGHLCQKKCFEECGTCTFIVNKILKQCGHVVQAPCGKCEKEIVCSFECKEILSCSHNCTNRCGEPCVKFCKQLQEAQSLICGHSVKVYCYIANNSELFFQKCLQQLFRLCSEKCNAFLSCGHKCKGTCGKCFQGRLHIACHERCNRILFCGHKCQSSCSIICPPCQHPCENKCIHSQCRKKCGEPCFKCRKKCEWSCSHKRCTLTCNEICNREPCDEACPKMLSCGHPCIGFCGEPCPLTCRVCNNEITNMFSGIEKGARFVLLEDCNHILELHMLNKWIAGSSEGNERILMKMCPLCSTVIRKNLRYNHIIKTSLLQLEKVKQLFIVNKKKGEELQSILLQKSITLTSLSNYKASHNVLFKFLSTNSVTNIQQLIAIENIISLAMGLNSSKVNHNLKFYPEVEVLQKLIQYTNFTKMWLGNFIFSSFQIVSEYQLLQMTYEFHRLKLIDQFLKCCSRVEIIQSNFTYFENCMQYLLNFTLFNNESVKNFAVAFEVLTSKLGDNNEDLVSPIMFPLLKSMSMSSGHWFECVQGHVYGVLEYDGFKESSCYECLKKTDDRPLSDHFKLSNMLSARNTKNWQQRHNIRGSSSKPFIIHQQTSLCKEWNKQYRKNSPQSRDHVFQEPCQSNPNNLKKSSHIKKRRYKNKENSQFSEDHCGFKGPCWPNNSNIQRLLNADRQREDHHVLQHSHCSTNDNIQKQSNGQFLNMKRREYKQQDVSVLQQSHEYLPSSDLHLENNNKNKASSALQTQK